MKATTILASLALTLGACSSGDVQADVTSDVTSDVSSDSAAAAVPDDSLTADLPRAAAFSLPDTAGKQHALSDYLGQDKLIVLEWFNPDCPVVKQYHQKTRRMAEAFTAVGGAEGITWLAINSGGAGKQGAGAERNAAAIGDYALGYPILMDESGEVGKAYGAKTTPHMFVIAPDGGILYQGAIDNSKQRDEEEQNLVMAAIEDHRAGRAVTTPKTAAFGCSVKYSD